MKTTFFLTLALLSLAAAAVPPEAREGKVFPLFSVVNFRNDACRPVASGVTDIDGTCYSSDECAAKGGQNSGNCAIGFGVCCTFVLTPMTSATITEERSVVANNGYPTAITAATQTITYTVTGNTEVCVLRYDFIVFNLGVGTAAGVTDGQCLDTFAVTNPSGGNNPPVLCGVNDGLHLLVDTGMSGAAAVATLTTGASTTRNRSWRIQITQIDCDDPNKPDAGCTQFFPAPSGEFTSFNWNAGNGRFLQSQSYTICFRTNGMCRITIRESSNTTPDPFLIEDMAGMLAMGNMANSGSMCNTGRISINGMKYCGQFLNSDTTNMATATGSVSQGAPFRISVYSPINVAANAMAMPMVAAVNAMMATGFNLVYSTSNTNCPT